MEERWVRASEAIRILMPQLSWDEARQAICRRAHAGLVRATAKRLVFPTGATDNCEIGPEFWWAEGGVALTQSWDTGDFSTHVDRTNHVMAFDVSFALADINDILGLGANGDGDADQWLPAMAALKRVRDLMGKATVSAEQLIVTYCRLGHIESRARSMTITYRSHLDEEVTDCEESLMVPGWFWEECTKVGASVLDWQRGIFSGRGIVFSNTSNVKLTGVEFHAAEFSVFASDNMAALETGQNVAPKHTKGGRPPAAWWDDLWIEIFRRIWSGDLKPKAQADLERAMLSWIEVGNKKASESTVRARARKLWVALNLEDEN